MKTAKIEIFVRKRTFVQNLKLSVKNRNVRQKSKFPSKRKVFVKIFVKKRNFPQNRNFVQKSKFRSKCLIQKSKFPSKIKIFPKTWIVWYNMCYSDTVASNYASYTASASHIQRIPDMQCESSPFPEEVAVTCDEPLIHNSKCKAKCSEKELEKICSCFSVMGPIMIMRPECIWTGNIILTKKRDFYRTFLYNKIRRNMSSF